MLPRMLDDTETSSSPGIFAHQSLRDYVASVDGLWRRLFSTPLRAEFAHYDELNSRPGVDGTPIMLPVNSEYQAEALHTVRARHTLSFIVAVTNDVTGHSTYSAIRSGANLVINIAISGARQAEILRAHLDEYVRSDRTAAAPRLRKDGHRTLNDSDERLLQMLCSSMTVAEIARQNNMSERSMYRRIRTLYDTLGVDSRAELISSTKQDGLGPPLTAVPV